MKKHKQAVLDKCCRTELNYIDKTIAYGASSSMEGSDLVVSVAAMKKKRITLVKVGSVWRAMTDIAGQQCYLIKIYINSKSGWTGYVDRSRSFACSCRAKVASKSQPNARFSD
jgi:hypothetical protein